MCLEEHDLKIREHLPTHKRQLESQGNQRGSTNPQPEMQEEPEVAKRHQHKDLPAKQALAISNKNESKRKRMSLHPTTVGRQKQ